MRKISARTVSALVVFAFALALAFCSFVPHVRGYGEHDACKEPAPNLRPGDYSYMHDCYHPIYVTLNKGTDDYWNSCCKGNECRVTEDIQDAPPEIKATGYDYLVVVDGRLCPVSVRQEIRLTDVQRAHAKTNPLYQSFLRHSHVCATFSVNGIVPRAEGTSPKYNPKEAMSCPAIHCIVVGPRS